MAKKKGRSRFSPFILVAASVLLTLSLALSAKSGSLGFNLGTGVQGVLILLLVWMWVDAIRSRRKPAADTSSTTSPAIEEPSND